MARRRFLEASVARLATAGDDGLPHIVPIVFAIDVDMLYFAVDAKPKQTKKLKRLKNIASNPAVSVIVDHYDDAVPFERMQRQAEQQGVPLSANTLASSVGSLIDVFDPVVRHIREAALSSDFAALDAMRMPVIDPQHPLGIRSGALWLIEGAHRYACFVYAPTGHDDHVEALLAGRTLGSVMCDGSATNNCVERAGGRRGGCNSHARRKIVESVRLGDLRGVEGIAIYAAIFHVDAESKRAGENID